MKSIYEEYAEHICSTCKGKCDKGIYMLVSDIKEVRCIDYVKDETKIKRIEPELQVTARKIKNFDRLFQ